MNKGLCLDIERCTGCKMCELACSMKHHNEYNPKKSRIRVHTFYEQAYSVPVVCYQCDDAWCEKICPSGAIVLNVEKEKGVKMLQVLDDKCVGCKMCMLACPFGNISFYEDGKANKCDLCGGDPECVRFCARGALKFKDIEDGVAQKSKSTAAKILAATQK